MRCSLCNNPDAHPIYDKEDRHLGPRRYYQCLTCQLIFLSPEHLLSPLEEKKRYDLHENSPDDEGYVEFLNQLLEPLNQKLAVARQGLDYGCGPGPTVSVLLKAHGHSVNNFDPIYFPEKALLERKYDFIVSTEVVEHFYDPRENFMKLQQMLKPQGYIGIMTSMYTHVGAFEEWWYHSEPTHVCFYHADTFEWIADWLGWEIEYLTQRVVILKKQCKGEGK